jgi:hypothetical protein
MYGVNPASYEQNYYYVRRVVDLKFIDTPIVNIFTDFKE